MNKIKKRSAAGMNAANRRRADRRRQQLDQAALDVERDAARLWAKYEGDDDKQARHAEDLKLLENVNWQNFDEPVVLARNRFLGNKSLVIERPGELKRQRGRLRTTTKITTAGEEPGASKLRMLQKGGKGRQTRKTHRFDDKGKLTSRNISRKDGRFQEKWEREDGKLVRTSFRSNRKRDGILVSAKMSKRGEDGSRSLTWREGALTEVFVHEADGKLTYVGQQNGRGTDYLVKSENGKTTTREIRNRNGKLEKAYTLRLAPDGETILGEDLAFERGKTGITITKFNKDGSLKQVIDTGLFGGTVKYIGNNHKVVSRKILFFELDPKLKTLSVSERLDQKRRLQEASEHLKAWDGYRPPSKGPVKRLGISSAKPGDEESFDDALADKWKARPGELGEDDGSSNMVKAQDDGEEQFPKTMSRTGSTSTSQKRQTDDDDELLDSWKPAKAITEQDESATKRQERATYDDDELLDSWKPLAEESRRKDLRGLEERDRRDSVGRGW
ncbi:hypothetical protein [Mesorhizobium sp. GbtcB19]|uniref:hypothetical protein n=1 Tax=Mesorhizobium sp. GbtcB19 TaxID=2824764 RepID=UPI001C2F93CA|nr:hypothetical protein [Mesorhizobium sp. GbtcB19]